MLHKLVLLVTTAVLCLPAGATDVPVEDVASPTILGAPKEPKKKKEHRDGSKNGTDVKPWCFQPVKSVKVRVQGNIPVWDAEHKTFITTFGANFDEKYRAVLDTVNMASVEGAFKFVQGEAINMNDQSAVVNCQRKSNIQYVVFYATTTFQPSAGVIKYDGTGQSALEHCPYASMDAGTCSGDSVNACSEYVGANGQAKIGQCVGGQRMDTDPLAPYPDTYWFSQPNSCPTLPWSKKTDQCREDQPGGLCLFGVQPDGIKCTFSFNVLGYIKLDDVVGITAMTNPATNKTYTDYTEFCKAGGVEFKAHLDGNKLVVEQSIPFWANAGDSAANSKRIQSLIKAYNDLVNKNPNVAGGGVMKPLPALKDLTKANPPCYVNSQTCAKAPNGCRRVSYGQVCEVCSGGGAGCVKKPANYVFPPLPAV